MNKEQIGILEAEKEELMIERNKIKAEKEELKN